MSLINAKFKMMLKLSSIMWLSHGTSVKCSFTTKAIHLESGVASSLQMAPGLTLLSEFIANMASLVACDRSVSRRKKGTTSL